MIGDTLAAPVYNVKTASRLTRKAGGAPYTAYVGADNGKIWEPKFPGYVYVREPLSYDPTSKRVTGGQNYLVLGHESFYPAYDSQVTVVFNTYLGEWMIQGTDPLAFAAQGGNPSLLNNLNPWGKVVNLADIGPARSYAVDNGNTASTLVSFNNFIYTDYLGQAKFFKIAGADLPDLTDYEPAANLKRLVHFWLNPESTLSVSQGTAISDADAFDATIDLAEVLEDRPDQLAMPIGAWIMANGDTRIGPDDFYHDTRPWLNHSQYAGFPNPVAYNYRIPSGVQETISGPLTVTANLTITGTLTITDPNPVVPPQPMGPIYAPMEVLHNSAAATSMTVNTGSLHCGWVNQTSPSDGQIVYQIKSWLSPGSYQVRCMYVKGNNRAIFKVQFTGPETVTTATIDGYNATSTANNIADDDISLTKTGEYTISILTDGKNGSSSDYYIVMQSLSITRN